MLRFIVCAITAVLFFATFTANAATPCDEWANMTKILVMRWQGDPEFNGKTNKDVKAALDKSMGGNPEIKTAYKWVDYAYKHKDKDSVQVWKDVYSECKKGDMI